jgi:ABC-type dipeptide/oligopeptide/nickel transport system permease subunit
MGGKVDSLLMRIADIQLTFPSILVALLVDGVVRAAVPREVHDQIALFVVIFAIGISNWPQFARTVRGSTLVERNKEYVQAARVIGLSPLRIMREPARRIRHPARHAARARRVSFDIARARCSAWSANPAPANR